ncbi:uncharacterized protein LOC110641110 [Hevea brasiliensis]|uniref:uncharacterized protein LOC110641110 n=1 Tax=Hevea brasiliensis TaxID=3981 RepID=UPI0025CE8F89|nr:uncharacterized protein LOC110641110 [Hevea brasiliensis]
MSPFEALYGIPPPIHLPYFPGDSKIATVDIFLRDRENALSILKFHLDKARHLMKTQANKGRVNRELTVGDWVFLKLQLYRQLSIRKGYHKFQPKYFGPFQITDRIGAVTYHLNFPSDAQIHNVFHVSQLKHTSAPVTATPPLPPVSHIQDAYP